LLPVQANARISGFSRNNADFQHDGYSATESSTRRYFPYNSYSSNNQENISDNRKSSIYNRAPAPTRQSQQESLSSSSQFNENLNSQTQTNSQSSGYNANSNRQQQTQSHQNYPQNPQNAGQNFKQSNNENSNRHQQNNQHHVIQQQDVQEVYEATTENIYQRSTQSSVYPDKIYFNSQQNPMMYPQSNLNQDQQNYGDRKSEVTTNRNQFQQNSQGFSGYQQPIRTDEINPKEQENLENQNRTQENVTDYNRVRHPDQKFKIDIKYPTINFATDAERKSLKIFSH
jgi:hypothetical protein